MRLKLVIAAAFFAGIVMGGLSGCFDGSGNSSFDMASIKTYRAIPGENGGEPLEPRASGAVDVLPDSAMNFHLVMLTAGLLALFILMLALFVKSYRAGEAHKNQMVTLAAVYDSLPDFVYSKDTKGAYTSCNHNFEVLAGLKGDEIIGKTYGDVFTQDGEHVLKEDQRVMSGVVTVKTENWYTFPDQSKRLYEIIKAPLLREGKVIGLLGIDRDITEHDRALRAAYSASRAKTSFLAKMSHEIRTPMNAIIGMTELALRANDLDTAKKHLSTVKQAGVHLLSIINDILDFSKIEEGKLEIIPGAYLFSSLINDVISIIRMRVIDSQVRFAIFIDSKIPNSLFGDETRIRQVLLNLLSNAVKYTEKGFVSLTVYGEPVDAATVNLIMEVMDSGKGIQEENLKLLFNEYTKVDIEKNRGIEGTGLGLAISHNIIKIMGGSISVYSEYNKGSTFTVTLPQKKCSDEVLASVKNPEEKTVIIYERREIYSHSFVCALDDLGVECTLVSEVSDLFEKLAAGTYSFIFIPLGILKTNADELLNFAKNAKIVVLTEFGAAVTDKRYSALSMPTYSLSIANILNGISGSFVFNETSDIAMFTAPDAKVLVVDDIQTNLKVAEGLLLPYRMNVDLCAGGKEALEAVTSTTYDLVFMDHKMPDMDGIEATLRIRGMTGKNDYYRKLPIIALTANAVSGTKETFLQCGFNDFLSKPIDTVRLNAVLEMWLPKEKQKTASSGGAKIPSAEDTPAGEDITIDGVDIKKGILFSGGTAGSFFETLAIFYKDGLEKIQDISSCLEQGDLHLYTIHVHALKSAAANIGAEKLSETAKALEAAGENNDLDYLNSHTGELLSGLESLLERIKTALAERGEKTAKEKTPCDAELLRRELVRLRNALKTLNAGIINDSAQVLQEMAGADKTGAVINTVADKILLGDYDEAVAMIDALLGEENGAH